MTDNQRQTLADGSRSLEPMVRYNKRANCSPGFKGVIVQIVRVVEIQFQSAWA